MRNAILPLSVALTLLTGCRSAPPESSSPDVVPGQIAWFDLTTTDLPRSKEFYGQLFDWTFAPVVGSDLAAEIVAHGTPIGTLRVADGSISGFNGVVYVLVADIRTSSKRASELGGTLIPGFPFDLPDGTGAVALVLDPSGHPVGMFSTTTLAEAARKAK